MRPQQEACFNAVRPFLLLFLITTTGGSSDLAAPAQSCSMCSHVTLTPPSPQCLAANFSLPCGCSSSAQVYESMLTSCPPSSGQFTCNNNLSPVSPCSTFPSSLSITGMPICAYVFPSTLPGVIESGFVQSDDGPFNVATFHVDMASSCYGEQDGYIGPLVQGEVAIGNDPNYALKATVYYTAFTPSTWWEVFSALHQAGLLE